MTPRKTKTLRMSPQPDEPLRVQNPHAAGIDVHAAEHWVAVPSEAAPSPPADHPPNLPPYVRRFGACTADLEALADWLQLCGVPWRGQSSRPPGSSFAGRGRTGVPRPYRTSTGRAKGPASAPRAKRSNAGPQGRG
jgi:hypothetical protein